MPLNKNNAKTKKAQNIIDLPELGFGTHFIGGPQLHPIDLRMFILLGRKSSSHKMVMVILIHHHNNNQKNEIPIITNSPMHQKNLFFQKKKRSPIELTNYEGKNGVD